jgi:glycogen synthase
VHVLQLAWELPPRLFGGLGRHVDGLSAALAAAGVEVTAATPELLGDERPPLPGVRVLRAAPPAAAPPEGAWVAEVLDANARMAERVLRAGVVADVLHVHDWMAGHCARVLAPALGLPVVATVHATERGRHQGHVPAGTPAWVDAQERALVALADRVVVCADHVREHVVAHLGAHPRRVAVVAGGVDAAAWADGPTRPAGALPRVVAAARLEHEKGLQVLFEATADLRCEVVVAGRGSAGPALRRAAHAGVRFDGHLEQPALAALLRSAAVVAVPSLYEPFGLVALEAMAAGAPVVASRTGGLRDLVGGAGLLVPPGDAPALRRALARVLEDPALAARLAAAGRARAAATTWDAAAAAHVDLYRDLLRERAAPVPPPPG